MRACTWVVTQRMTPDSRKDQVMLNATKKGKKGGTAGAGERTVTNKRKQEQQ